MSGDKHDETQIAAAPATSEANGVPEKALAPCRFRHTYKGIRCTHPQVAKPADYVLVSVKTCEECPYVHFSAAELIEQYTQRVDLAPTEEEFAERVNHCDDCEYRQGNSCELAGGSCSLSQKLAKGSFICPEKKFLSIARER